MPPEPGDQPGAPQYDGSIDDPALYLLGQPLQIGKGGLREGVILDLLNGSASDLSVSPVAA